MMKHLRSLLVFEVQSAHHLSTKALSRHSDVTIAHSKLHISSVQAGDFPVPHGEREVSSIQVVLSTDSWQVLSNQEFLHQGEANLHTWNAELSGAPLEYATHQI